MVLSLMSQAQQTKFCGQSQLGSSRRRSGGMTLVIWFLMTCCRSSIARYSTSALCQACPSILNSQEIPITIKRPLPSRLTYKAQSEPIVFRLPQQDPHFTIELYGQDLIFDPPILQFSRSSEASFRVTGASLGLKTMTMCRSGPNAIKYSGLPLSHSIVVERAFMKNTFQIAFVNPDWE
jgi:hypothetical protein